MDMTQDLSFPGFHRAGEQPLIAGEGSPPAMMVDSFAGADRVEWAHRAAFTPLAQLPFFIDFLKTAALATGRAYSREVPFTGPPGAALSPLGRRSATEFKIS
jgi:hypothetical protein